MVKLAEAQTPHASGLFCRGFHHKRRLHSVEAPFTLDPGEIWFVERDVPVGVVLAGLC